MQFVQLRFDLCVHNVITIRKIKSILRAKKKFWLWDHGSKVVSFSWFNLREFDSSLVNFMVLLWNFLSKFGNFWFSCHRFLSIFLMMSMTTIFDVFVLIMMVLNLKDILANSLVNANDFWVRNMSWFWFAHHENNCCDGHKKQNGGKDEIEAPMRLFVFNYFMAMEICRVWAFRFQGGIVERISKLFLTVIHNY